MRRVALTGTQNIGRKFFFFSAEQIAKKRYLPLLVRLEGFFLLLSLSLPLLPRASMGTRNQQEEEAPDSLPLFRLV